MIANTIMDEESIIAISSQLKSTMSVSSRSGKTGWRKRNYIDSIAKNKDSNAPLVLLEYLKEELYQKTSIGIIGYVLSTMSDVVNDSLDDGSPITWRRKFIVEKGPELILALAIKYKTKPSVVEPCLSLTSTFVGDPVRSKMQFRLCEAFKDLITFVFKEHISNEEVMEQACKAIGYFVAGIPPNRKIQEEFLNINIIESVIKLMAYHKESKWIQTEGCGALLLLAFDSPTNRREILKHGGLKAIKIAMESFPYDIHVSKYARLAKSEVYTLEEMLIQYSSKINNEDKNHRSRAGDLETKKSHEDDHESLRKSIAPKEIVKKSEIEYNNVTLNTCSYRKDDIKKGRLSIQVNPTFFKGLCIGQNYTYKVITRPEPSIDMMEALAELGAKNDEVRNNIMKMGGVKAIIEGMISKQKDMEVQRNGALVLYFLGKENSKLCKQIVKCGGNEVLSTARELFPNEPYVLRWVRLALYEIKMYG